jgi:hypothetical protein
MCDLLDDVTWLFRGVPSKSPEVEDVLAINEVRPPRPERTGEFWRYLHSEGDTETAYTSWTSDRSLAEAAAEHICDTYNLSGGVVIFRVPVRSISQERIYPAREDEDEWLIEGTVEDVIISEDPLDEEDEHEQF